MVNLARKMIVFGIHGRRQIKDGKRWKYRVGERK